MLKRACILVSAVAIAAVPLRSSVAGDKEWATAGKVMAGLAALAIISDLVADHPVVHVHHPAPRRVIHVNVSRRVWVEGRYVEAVQEVWVPSRFDSIWEPPVHERVWVATTYGGRWQEIIVRPGFYKRVWCPGHYAQTVETRWIPGHWEEI